MKPEQELIAEILAGDANAYAVLVDRYQARLFNSMLHIVNSHDEAEDVVQESFVQAFVKLHTFQGNSQFFTWLYRIAFNNALSRQRKKKADVSLDHTREAGGTDPEDRHEPPDEPMLREERVHLVHEALNKLSEEHRAVLVLREMQDTSYEDIAEILSINIGTVRSRLSRARAQLKTNLEEIEARQMREAADSQVDS